MFFQCGGCSNKTNFCNILRALVPFIKLTEFFDSGYKISTLGINNEKLHGVEFRGEGSKYTNLSYTIEKYINSTIL